MKQSASTQSTNLTGKVAVVTGASDGIGHVIATHLARAGAHVVMPVRNSQKGERAAARIREDAPGASVETAVVDLASLDSVNQLVHEFTTRARPIQFLVNNAGVMRPPSRQTTADGYELQFGTNHLAHFALTLGLLPLLKEGRARVTHQTSVAARKGSINWDDLNWTKNYGDGMAAYVQSKIAVGLFARELNARSETECWGITSNVSHPGVSPTNLLAAQPGMGRDQAVGSRRIIQALSRVGLAGTVSSAALPAVTAATSADAHGDELYGPKRTIAGPPARMRDFWAPLRDMEAARRLWDESARLIEAQRVK